MVKVESAKSKSVTTGPPLIQSVDRALTLLEILAVERDEMSLQALSRRAGLNPSTAYRLLHTLKAHGLVHQSPNSREYGLGLKILWLASAVHSQLDLRRETRPFLESLAQRSGETANLAVLEGDEAVYIDQVPSAQPIRAFTQIGARVPLHCTGVGKILLAYMPVSKREELIRKGLPAVTKNTITNPLMLTDALAKARDQGFTLDLEERQEQVRCIAVPVLNHQSEVVATLSISGPIQRLTAQNISELVPLVKQAGLEASSALGYPGQVPEEAMRTARREQDADVVAEKKQVAAREVEAGEEQKLEMPGEPSI